MKTGRPEKYKIKLTQEEQTHLLKLLKKGKHPARTLTRARILLLAHKGTKQDDIQSILNTSNSTICTIKKRYCQEGLSAALEERPRPGAKPKLNAKAEAHLIALACTKAPDGRESWTMQLLADQLVELGIVDEISDETVRLTLKKKTKALA